MLREKQPRTVGRGRMRFAALCAHVKLPAFEGVQAFWSSLAFTMGGALNLGLQPVKAHGNGPERLGREPCG